MAEILGAVASGLAVAEVGLKVGGTVWKLKRLWQQVHEVPEIIQDLMKQIEIMDPVLSDHETNLHVQSPGLLELPTRHGSPAMLSAAYCREALNDLRRLVDDLDCAIKSETRTRRTFARVGVVLKKDTIRGFQDRLERAIKLLQWTQVNYLAANATIMGAMVTDVWTAVTSIQSQQQLFMQQLSTNNYSSSTGKLPFPVVTSDVEPSQEHILDKRKSTQHQRDSIHIPWSGSSIFGALEVRKSETDATGEASYAVRFQLPKWLSRKVWDINISRACSGWQGSLYTWNIVPDDSPGMLCAKKGDLDGLIDLFNRGLASPRDCDAEGYLLFQIACGHLHTHIVKYFISMNLDKPCITSGLGEFAAIFITGAGLPPDILTQLVSRGLIDDLANATEDFELSNGPVTHNFASLVSTLALIWTMDYPEGFELVFRTAMKDPNGLPPWTCHAFRLIFCPNGPVQKTDVQAWIDGDASLLHQVFFCYLSSSSRGLDRGWETLLEEVIEATDDMHHRLDLPYAYTNGCDDDTCGIIYIGARSALEWALVAVLSGLLSPGLDMGDIEAPVRRVLKKFMWRLQALVSVLASCGYDLLEFGRQEAIIWVSEDNNTDRIVGDTLYLGIGDQHDGLPYVRAVHYGSAPEDWYFELDFHYEDYAGDFWNLLENPHLLMPGAWIETE